MKKLLGIVLCVACLCLTAGRKRERIETVQADAVLQVGGNEGARGSQPFDWSEYWNEVGNVNATWGIANGIAGGGYLYNGTNSRMNIDDVQVDLAGTKQGTWSVWVKPTDVTTDWLTMVGFGDTDANLFLVLQQGNTDGNVHAGYTRGAGDPAWRLITTSGTELVNGTWTHIVLVQNGSVPVFYINGVVVAQTFTQEDDKTAWFADSAAYDNGRMGCIDYNGGGNVLFFAGSLDEAYIFNRAFSAAECLLLYEYAKANRNL